MHTLGDYDNCVPLNLNHMTLLTLVCDNLKTIIG